MYVCTYVGSYQCVYCLASVAIYLITAGIVKNESLKHLQLIKHLWWLA